MTAQPSSEKDAECLHRKVAYRLTCPVKAEHPLPPFPRMRDASNDPLIEVEVEQPLRSIRHVHTLPGDTVLFKPPHIAPPLPASPPPRVKRSRWNEPLHHQGVKVAPVLNSGTSTTAQAASSPQGTTYFESLLVTRPRSRALHRTGDASRESPRPRSSNLWSPHSSRNIRSPRLSNSPTPNEQLQSPTAIPYPLPQEVLGVPAGTSVGDLATTPVPRYAQSPPDATKKLSRGEKSTKPVKKSDNTDLLIKSNAEHPTRSPVKQLSEPTRAFILHCASDTYGGAPSLMGGAVNSSVSLLKNSGVGVTECWINPRADREDRFLSSLDQFLERAKPGEALLIYLHAWSGFDRAPEVIKMVEGWKVESQGSRLFFERTSEGIALDDVRSLLRARLSSLSHTQVVLILDMVYGEEVFWQQYVISADVSRTGEPKYLCIEELSLQHGEAFKKDLGASESATADEERSNAALFGFSFHKRYCATRPRESERLKTEGRLIHFLSRLVEASSTTSTIKSSLAETLCALAYGQSLGHEDPVLPGTVGLWFNRHNPPHVAALLSHLPVVNNVDPPWAVALLGRLKRETSHLPAPIDVLRVNVNMIHLNRSVYMRGVCRLYATVRPRPAYCKARDLERQQDAALAWENLPFESQPAEFICHRECSTRVVEVGEALHGLRGHEVPINEIISISIGLEIPDLLIQVFRDRGLNKFDCLGSAVVTCLDDAEAGVLSRMAQLRSREGAHVGWVDLIATVFRS